MLHLLSRAINPKLRLGEALQQWASIARRLAERPRKRRRQMQVLPLDSLS
jgi:hypothetical protein